MPVTDVRCSLCDTLKLPGMDGWITARVGEGECCPRCFRSITEGVRPWRVESLPTDPDGANSRENLLAIGRGERWKGDHEAGERPRWLTKDWRRQDG